MTEDKMGEKRKYTQTDSAEGSKKTRPTLFAENKETVPGIIKRVHLKDFMVHADFTWEPGYNVNFVVGGNGSGKSSVLQGIVIGLMAEAKHTKRYKLLSDFIRRGANKAVIKVSILNTGDNPYNFEKYGPLITFCRTLNKSGNTMQLLDHKNLVVSTSVKAAREEGKRILQHFDIQIDNPLTVLQQDHAKEMLRVEKPEKLFALFESATLIKQAREQYQNAHIEISQLKIEMTSLEKDVEDVKKEANKYIEEYNKATRNTRKDQEITSLHKERSWARLIKAKEEVQKKQEEETKLCLKMEESKLKVSKFAADIIQLEKEELDLKVLMDESISEESGVREHYESKRENNRKKELKVKDIAKDIKQNVDNISYIESDITILQEMLKRFSNNANSVKAIEEKIQQYKAEERKIDRKKDEKELEREKIDQKGFTNGIEIKNKSYEILADKNSLQNLFYEREHLMNIQSANDVLAVYPKASEVQAAIESNLRLFKKRPLGPVGRYLRVKTNDSNLTGLLETEIGHKTLSSYLCDNENDRKILINILNRFYVDGVKPMIFTSKFLEQQHKVIKPPELTTVLDLIEFVGTEYHQIVVFNFLVDVRQVEAVVVVENQEKAKSLTTFEQNVPRGLAYCITRDWYKFIPPTRSGSYRSYYIVKRTGVGLLNVSFKEKINEKKEEITDVKVKLNLLTTEKNLLQNVKNGIEEQSRKVRIEIDEINKELLEVGTNLRKANLKLEDLDAPDNIEKQIEEKKIKLKHLEMDTIKKKIDLEELKKDIDDAQQELGFMREEITELNKKLTPLNTELNKLEAKKNSIQKLKTQELSKYQKLNTELFNIKSETKKNERDIVSIEDQARKLTNNVELTPSESLEKIQAKINIMTKEKLTRKEQGDCMAIKTKYDELLLKYELKKNKLKSLRKFCENLESMESQRLEVFRQIKLITIRRVERRFNELAEESKMAINISLRIDHREREIVFMFGSGKSSKADLSTMSGGEKSYAQLCLILSLWDKMHTPFRCLDEWDVFLDAINRKSISMELFKFAVRKAGEFQFIFISPQGALDVPQNKSVKIFKMGSVDQ